MKYVNDIPNLSRKIDSLIKNQGFLKQNEVVEIRREWFRLTKEIFKSWGWDNTAITSMTRWGEGGHNWEKLHRGDKEEDYWGQFSSEIHYCSNRMSMDRWMRCHWLFNAAMSQESGQSPGTKALKKIMSGWQIDYSGEKVKIDVKCVAQTQEVYIEEMEVPREIVERFDGELAELTMEIADRKLFKSDGSFKKELCFVKGRLVAVGGHNADTDAP